MTTDIPHLEDTSLDIVTLFDYITLQFQKDVNLAASPSSPQHPVEQLIDIYANNVKDLFNNNV
jgi:transcriptional regulator with AAA-type ATPase domain